MPEVDSKPITSFCSLLALKSTPHRFPLKGWKGFHVYYFIYPRNDTMSQLGGFVIIPRTQKREVAGLSKS